MNKLTEIKEALKAATPGKWRSADDGCEDGGIESDNGESVVWSIGDLSAGVGMRDEDANLISNSKEYITYLISLLEEKDKALAFYADEKNYMELRDYETRSIIPIIPIAEDQGFIARKALNTSSNQEGES